MACISYLILLGWCFLLFYIAEGSFANLDALIAQYRGQQRIKSHQYQTAVPTTQTATSKRTTVTDKARCMFQPECPSIFIDKFTTVDGSCNNRVDKNNGRTQRPYKRLVPADYSEKNGQPRRAKNNQPLPSARLISSRMSEITSQRTLFFSQMVPFWGQYIAHDIARTPVVETNDDGTKVNCNCFYPSPGCFNIRIPKTDEQYIRERKPCFPFQRSLPVTDASSINCDTSSREQLNQLTGYIDVGTIYGNSESYLSTLLDPNSEIGELKEKNAKVQGREALLPLQGEIGNSSIANMMECPHNRKPKYSECFVSGDVRANENSGLTSQHTLWMRYHNQIVKKLHVLNPAWDGLLLFKTTREIVTALHQIVTYKHFLPAVVSELYMKRFGLNLLKSGYWYGYDSSYDATVSNAFTTAAFRMGHSLVGPKLSRPWPSWHRNEGLNIPLKESFFNMEPLLNHTTGGPNSVYRGLLKEVALKVDPTFTNDLRNFLFAEKDRYGFDLLALNIQRGRDHGLPGYNRYRRFCGMKEAKSFEDLSNDMNPVNLEKLKSLYNDVDDIDLYIGGLSELPVEDGLVGPTFACIISYQFRDIRRGDRLWHENGGILNVFTPDQLDSLRRATFSGILCDGIPDMTSVQPHPMKIASGRNFRRSCSQFKRLDLTPWKQNYDTYRLTKQAKEVPDTEWSQWFPTCGKNGQCLSFAQTYSSVLRHRTEQVCHQVLETQSRKLNGKIQVRFQCAAGTIRYTDFPVIPSDNLIWSDWINDHTPDYKNGNDIEINLLKKSLCLKPTAFQAQSINGTPTSETGDVFQELNLFTGLVCRGSDQPSGKCHNYKIRYLCEKVASKMHFTNTSSLVNSYWTEWLSTDTEHNYGDIEHIAKARRVMKICRNPIDIQARTVNGKIPLKHTNDVIRRIRPDRGFSCHNSDQPRGQRCHNYEIRYKCSAGSTNKNKPTTA